jgi:hypothetical protein
MPNLAEHLRVSRPGSASFLIHSFVGSDGTIAVALAVLCSHGSSEANAPLLDPPTPVSGAGHPQRQRRVQRNTQSSGEAAGRLGLKEWPAEFTVGVARVHQGAGSHRDKLQCAGVGPGNYRYVIATRISNVDLVGHQPRGPHGP